MTRSTLSELEFVLAVARWKSFSKAAVELNVSRAVVSKAVASIEDNLGTRIFHRTTRSVALTNEGQAFVAQIAPSVLQIQDVIAVTKDKQAAHTGTLRINSSLGAALMVFQPFIVEFLRRYPQLSLDIACQEQLIDVVGEGFDAGLRPAGKVPLDMIGVPISESISMTVVGSPGYFNQRPVPANPDDLSSHLCIGHRLPNGMSSPWEFTQGDQIFRIAVPAQLTLDSPLLMLEAARNGLGLAQVAKSYVEEDLAKGSLITVLDNWAATLPGLSLYYSGRRHLPNALKLLIKTIRELK